MIGPAQLSTENTLFEIKNPDLLAYNMFDKAQEEVLNILTFDPLPRFASQESYKRTW